jgi:anti-sigma factor RsiW
MMDKRPKQLDLMAFADDELDGDAKVELLRQLVEHPDDARALVHQQQLRSAVEKAMTASTPAMPAELRSRIEAMVEPAAVETDTSPIARLGFVGRWMPAAVAAVLLLGAVVVLNVMMRLDQPSTRPDQIAGTNLPPTALHPIDLHLVGDETLSRFAGRHERCTTTPGTLMEADWPDNLERLPAALSEYLGAPTSGVLDLSALGYQFAGAGPCRVPGDKSAHLIYHRITDGERESISLWICPDDQRYDVPEQQMYRVTDPDAAHPVLLWRSNGTIYYLVADSPLDAEKACGQLIAQCR